MTIIRRLNTIKDLDKTTISALLDAADMLEKHRLINGYLPAFLRGKCLALIFDNPSLRTRNSFERAMIDLGGHAIYFTGKEIRIDRNAIEHENIKDLVNVIGGFNDALLIRILGDDDFHETIAKLCPVPFINGMNDTHHPTQALCDFLTIRRKIGFLENIKIAFIGNNSNVALSLAQTASIMGSNFVLATPEGYGFDKHITDELQRFSWTSDPRIAAQDADVVITDNWIPLRKRNEPSIIHQILAPYQVNKELMAMAKPNAFFLHNLPAIRGEEVSEDVIDDPKFITTIYEEAIARLHIARALMLYMLHPNPQECINVL